MIVNLDYMRFFIGISVLLVMTLVSIASLKGSRMVKIVVLDRQNQTLSTLQTPQELSKFEEIWKKKTPVSEGSHMEDSEFKFTIRIEMDRSELWRYHPAGLTQVLTKSRARLYRIEDVHEFSSLLRLPESLVKTHSLPKTRKSCEKEVRSKLMEALKNSPSSRLFKWNDGIGPMLKNYREAKNSFTKLELAAALAILDSREGLSTLKGCSEMTNSKIEYFIAKASLFLLNEKIPDSMINKHSVFDELEQLMNHCLASKPNSQ